MLEFYSPDELRVPPPFEWYTPQNILPLFERLVGEAKHFVEYWLVQDLNAPISRLMELDRFTDRLDLAYGIVELLESVLATPALRQAFGTVQKEVAEFRAGLSVDSRLYERLREIESTERGELGTEQHRYLTKRLEVMERSGAGLPAEHRARLVAIESELSELCTKFTRNVLDSTNAFEFRTSNRDDLRGLPERVVQAASDAARSRSTNGNGEEWAFNLHPPTYLAVMTYCDSPVVRERFWRAYFTRATSGLLDNRPIMARILQLRRERATILGFESFGELILADRMLQSPQEVRDFLDDLLSRVHPRFEIERDELLAFRRETDGDTVSELEPWDVAYFQEKERLSRLKFDEELLRPYFPLTRVVHGLFEVVRRLFGVDIRGVTSISVYHSSVRSYEVIDSDGTPLGYFYLDLFPRESKRGGAWMSPLHLSVVRHAPHLGLIGHNATPPVNGAEAMLSHREALTLFHEMGHLLHLFFSRVSVRALGGMQVPWDFIELPSQLLENWCWEPEGLALIGSHIETGEPIPEELVDALRSSRTFRSATLAIRQIGFALMDLELHTIYDPDLDGSILEYSRALLERFAVTPLPDEYALTAHFTHLFGHPVGYAAGYYSYKWSEVLDADVFTHFTEHGLFSREVGDRYRNDILAPGALRDPSEIFESFMGRPPTTAALLRRMGIAEEKVE